MRRWVAAAIVGLGILTAVAVLPQFARRVETQPHPAAQYVAIPGTYRAGLARTIINRHHMRAVESDKYPVLIMGDSVALGWARIDQPDTAVGILTQRLGVPVGNASANSWGPPNLLGYARTFGLFDARVVVLLLSAHDAADMPESKNLSHLSPPDPGAISALEQLVAMIRETGAIPLMALHRERDEPDHAPGRLALLNLAHRLDIQTLSLQIPDAAYFDRIHPNADGQRMIAEQLEPLLRRMLKP